MKGISPLIAAVLLIAFTVAIATLVAGWFSTLTRTTTASVTNTTTRSVSCSGASISIDAVYLNPGTSAQNGSARVIVRNNGLANLSVTAATMFNVTGNGFVTSTTTPVVLGRGNVTNLAFTPNMTACPGAFSMVVVATDCGGVSDSFTGTPTCVS